ncbi:trans-sulfuration enzyme family protein [Salisediminibacterium selenitireducens]|uniref:homocysteine desulfhydrase n=1 Tax=Bacillus selenitireducens (strain ATCC 700615 / DSM 15326 / MLS10) TaxID=439292 RepID=D6XY10_BACIE|nr:aminotransferase class I/II-fold pyridoxal phosphate-dependent enzyme [Salisediminibacterium selenitireducens]ADH98083.1 Cystathionine gamma-synthase [[Bacillus] selenitireducens MLS10]
MKFRTDNVHLKKAQTSGEYSKTTPIYQTSAFAFKDIDDMEQYFNGDKSYLYTRMGNPNTDELGQAVAALEGAEAGVASSSGLSAILAGFLSVAKPGDHVIVAEDLYGGTFQLINDEIQGLGIRVTFMDMTNVKDVEAAITADTVMIYTESITNPLLRVEDLEGISALAKAHDLKLMVDNTFATPYLIRPLENGADLVVHSATKYIGGHSDVTAGVIVGGEALISEARKKIVTLGSNLGPFDSWLAVRGLKTLSLRMRAQCENAQKLSDALRQTQGIKKVYYPEHASDSGNGAVVTIDLEDGLDVNAFTRALDWVKVVPTLAGVETTVSYPEGTSHRALTPEMRTRLGVTPQMIRISVGIEDPDDIVGVFVNAVAAIR